MAIRLIIALAVILWIPIDGFSQEQRATLRDGETRTGQLEAGTAEQLTFSAQQNQIPLDAIQRIEFPSGSPVLNSSSPARIFHLRGGGTITGELLEFTKNSITLRTRGKTVELPRRAVLAMDQLAEESQLYYDDFNADSLSPQWKSTGAVELTQLESQKALRISPGGSCRYQLAHPIKAGQCSVAFFDPQLNPAPSCDLELQFGDEQATSHSLTIHFSSRNEFYTVSHSPQLQLIIQRVKRKPGWSTATVLFGENRFQVLIGSCLLAYGRSSREALQSVRLVSKTSETNNAPNGKSPNFWFDNLQITERISKAALSNSFVLDSQSQIILENGDVVFGELVAIDSRQIQLKGAFGEATLPWREVRRIVFRKGDFPAHPISTKAPRTGWQAGIQFQRFVDHPTQPGDELHVTLLAIQDGQITVEHSELGEIKVPAGEVSWIEPQFFGRRLVLASATAHLGNQVRPKFLHKDPLGSSWHGEFSLERIPEGAAFVRVRVSDLEPAGKDTPPGSRYLSELRNGFLGTAVVLNGESLGRLNDSISRQKTLDDGQTVRLPIPSRLLRKGKNTWRIEQTSRRDDPREFDDCQIGPVLLEIESR